MRTRVDPSSRVGGTGRLGALGPVAAVAFALVTWASAFVAIRHLGTDVPPGSLSLGRLVTAVVVLGAMAAARGGPRLPPRRTWPLIVLGGGAWIGVYNLALNAAEQRIDAATAALLVQIGPILVAGLATVFLGERLARRLVVGLAVGFAGVVLIARAATTGAVGDLVGVLLGVLTALTFAVGVLCQKSLLTDGMTALEMTFWFYVVGAVTCLPWSVELVGVVGRVSAADLAWIGYLGAVPSAVAFTAWAYALAHAEAGRFAMTTFLVPFLTALLAWLALDEVPPALAFVGGGLCIIGVLVTQRRPRPAESPGAGASTAALAPLETGPATTEGD